MQSYRSDQINVPPYRFCGRTNDKTETITPTTMLHKRNVRRQMNEKPTRYERIEQKNSMHVRTYVCVSECYVAEYAKFCSVVTWLLCVCVCCDPFGLKANPHTIVTYWSWRIFQINTHWNENGPTTGTCNKLFSGFFSSETLASDKAKKKNISKYLTWDPPHAFITQ